MNEELKQQLAARYAPKEIKVIQLDRQLSSARYSPCGKFLVAAGYDGLVRRWDLSKDETPELPPLSGHNGWVQDVAFDPAGRLLYTADTWGQLRAWSIDSEPPQLTWSQPAAHDGWIHDLSVSPDGKLLATCGADGAVRVWSTADGARVHELTGHGVDVFQLGFHPAGTCLVSADMKGAIKEWNLLDGACRRQFDASLLFKFDRLQDVGGVRSLAFSADGALLACGGTQPVNGGNVQGTPTVLVFDFASGQLRHTLVFGKPDDVYVCDLRFHADGFLMAATSGNPGVGKLIYRRLDDDAPFFETAAMANCHSLSLHPNGLRLAVAATNTGSNGNGRALNDKGEYVGNWSPIHILEMPAPISG